MLDNPRKRIAQVFGLVNRELWVVTAATDTQRGGLIATWVSQASIDTERPVVVVGLAPNHFTAKLVEQSGSFAAHLLRPDQLELVWRFGLGSGRDRDKFAGLECGPRASGAPVLNDCLAWIECRVIARYDAGDRTFFWADAVDGGQAASGPVGLDRALTEHEMVQRASDQQLQSLAESRCSDISLQRQLAAEWRSRLEK